MSTCRRMWTDRQIRSMAVDSVEEKENLEIFERIVDKDGHKRFIEGEIELADSITYLTNLYGKWSLSGSHLMLVICIRTDENTKASPTRGFHSLIKIFKNSHASGFFLILPQGRG